MLPVLVYVAMVICWCVAQFQHKWVVRFAFVFFAIQFVYIHLVDYGLIDKKRIYQSFRPINNNYERLEKLMDTIVQYTSDRPLSTMTLSL